MRETVTVAQAISKAKWTINTPSLIILFGMFFGSIILYTEKYFNGWIIALGSILGIVFAWLFWSLSIVKWKIWAFENVRNVHELKRKAIQNNLIWKDDSWFNKTEIINYEQKQKLKRLEKKFLEKDVYYDDSSVPKETIVNFSKGGIVFGFVFGIGAIVLGIYTFLQERNNYFILLFVAFGLYFLFITIKKATSNEPQISINSLGIKLAKKDFMDWHYITDDFVESRRSGKYTQNFLRFEFHNQHHEIQIDDLNTNSDKIEKLLHVYRVRYEKNNPSES
ncbi:hypothetical protein OX283_011390 [Flavobacterium sp. SUN052]|uniref:hypothetical protein n=1 Tax=Flavobacterium sp. SUN052 TaxID=3002441 RepID=UPI00237EAC04|nr:hypothetical protein [Flavobacterium sp. SUN052]MEC4005263.1 hypothetical protein [Flavobacterium sp. SUN052]